MVLQFPHERVPVLDVLDTRKGFKDIIPIDDILTVVLIARDLQDVCGSC
jgi:hypothetical protein